MTDATRGTTPMPPFNTGYDWTVRPWSAAWLIPRPHPLDRILPELTYKAGYRFELNEWDYGLHLHVMVTEPDHDKPGEIWRGVHAIPVPQLPMEASDEWWLRWVLEALAWIAFHETREALRYRGVQYFRPAHHGQPDRDGSEHPHAAVPWPSPGPLL